MQSVELRVEDPTAIERFYYAIRQQSEELLQLATSSLLVFRK